MNKKHQVLSLIDRIRQEVDMAEIYKDGNHFNQARMILSNELPGAIRELEAECEEKGSTIASKSI